MGRARRVSASSMPDDDNRSMRSDSDLGSMSDELAPPFDLAALGEYAGTTSEVSCHFRVVGVCGRSIVILHGLPVRLTSVELLLITASCSPLGSAT